jgi:hypothetical protein
MTGGATHLRAGRCKWALAVTTGWPPIVIIDPMKTSVQRRSPNRRKESKMFSLFSRQKPKRLMLVEPLVDDEARRIGVRPHLSVVRETDATELTTLATARRELPIYEVDERDAS